MGDAQSFLEEDRDPSDSHGHGTFVAGIAVWGDVVESLIEAREAQPLVRLLSGKVLKDDNTYDPKYIGTSIREAVEEFQSSYGCRIFNLSLGNRHVPYDGGRLGGLAVVLDGLAREFDVLFVVSTGNLSVKGERAPEDWRRDYPSYFFSGRPHLIDPAPAINVLTVGSFAYHEASFIQQRHRHTIEEGAIARAGAPSPFTRVGPSVDGALKPELLAHGGNWSWSRRKQVESRGLGCLSASRDFTGGKILAESCGTSFAAPFIAHHAARLVGLYPDASPALLRALLVAHGEISEMSRETLEGDGTPAEMRDRIQKVCGYGALQKDSLYKSDDDTVVMYTDRQDIKDDETHFFEIPLPDAFLGEEARGNRILTVALAHTPAVRTTRLGYRQTRMEFKLIAAEHIDEASKANSAHTSDEDYENIQEIETNRSHSSNKRKCGSIQASTWAFKHLKKSSKLRTKKLFVVVRRNDRHWATDAKEKEQYALVVRMMNRDTEESIYLQARAALRAKQQARTRARS